MDESHYVVIEIEYLKTYENIGIIYINTCGQVVAAANGLWEDWKEYRVSYVRILEYFLSHENCKRDSDELISVEVTYYNTDNLESLTEGKSAHFKIVAVMACFVDMTEPDDRLL